MMDLLTTKLSMPPLRPNLVARPQLLHRLNEGLQHGRALTLVSAPAGYGKTTLIAEWGREFRKWQIIDWKGDSPALPPDFQPAAEVDLSSRSYDGETLMQFTLSFRLLKFK